MAQVLAFLVLLAGAWYLLIMRPQRNQQENHVNLVGQLRVGDHVMTIGGIFGRVESMHGDSILLEVAPGITARVVTEGIARIVDAPDPRAIAQQQASSLQHLGMPAQQDPVVHQPSVAQPVAQVQLPPQQYTQPQIQPINGYAPQPAFAQPTQQQGFQTFTAQVMPVQHQQPQPPAQVGGYHIQSPFAAAAPPQQSLGYPQQPVANSLPGLMPTQPMATPNYQQQPPVAPLVQHQVQVPAADLDGRKSAAPQGMGRSERIDDSTRQMFERARAERAEMAGEYQRVVAPFVNHDEAPQHQIAPPAQIQAYAPQGQLAPAHAAPAPSLFVHGAPASINSHSVFPPPAQLPPAVDPRQALLDAQPTNIPYPHGHQAPPIQNTAQVFDNNLFQTPAPFTGHLPQQTEQPAAV